MNWHSSFLSPRTAKSSTNETPPKKQLSVLNGGWAKSYSKHKYFMKVHHQFGFSNSHQSLIKLNNANPHFNKRRKVHMPGASSK